MRLLAVDIGNSSIRFGLFEGVEINASTRPTRCLNCWTSDANFNSLEDWLPSESVSWFVGSVNGPAARRLAEWKAHHYSDGRFRLFEHVDFALEMEVDSPRHVGIDRIAAAVAANATREPDRIVVWDWKSGRTEQTGLSFQMAYYAYYVSNTYRIPVGHVVTRRFELFRDELHEASISEGSLDELLTYIRGSIKDMRSLLDDPDRNLAREERFAKVEKREVCYRCNFLKVCEPSL